PVAADPIGAQRIDEQDDDVRRRWIGRLPRAPAALDDPDAAPSRRAGRRPRARGVGREHDLDLASGLGGQIDMLVEPDPVGAAGRRVDDAREALRAVDEDPEAKTGGLPILAPVTLHADA